MYALLLILRYLRRKIAPMFAVLAVMLCSAMVIIVISVMGGFLSLLTDAVQKLEGDVTVTNFSLRGFSDYEPLREALEQLDEVEAAAAVVRNFGLITMGQEQVTAVQIFGIHPDQYARVMDYRRSLYWTRDRTEAFYSDLDLVKAAMAFQPPQGFLEFPAIVTGVAVSGASRNEAGEYELAGALVGQEVVLTAMDVTGTPRPVPKRMTVVNEYKSGLYEVDSGRVFVAFDFLQRALGMHEEQAEDEQGTMSFWPARANEVVVRGRRGVPLEQVEAAVQQRTIAFMSERPHLPPLYTRTPEQRHATLIGAVKKEKMMLTVLFAIISLVAVAMIGVIFYMIVMEKTRDIGVLRAMGASRSGVASVFLGYGLAIGVVGSLLGLALAALIVYNLNEIQDLLTKAFGFTMWDPRVYYFDRIPGRLDQVEVMVIMIGAVLSGLIGAMVPAYLASRQNPVEAVRYE